MNVIKNPIDPAVMSSLFRLFNDLYAHSGLKGEVWVTNHVDWTEQLHQATEILGLPVQVRNTVRPGKILLLRLQDLADADRQDL